MKVHTALGRSGYEFCYPIDKTDFDTINEQVNGTARQSTWRPIPMRLIREDNGERLLASDSPWLGEGALIFRPNAVKALGPLLRDQGELLPLACNGAELFMYNPTHVIDALDEEASTVTRFKSGRIMMIQRYVFRADVIGELDTFKIPIRVSPTFLSQRFVDRWEASDLQGLQFTPLWAQLPKPPPRRI